MQPFRAQVVGLHKVEGISKKTGQPYVIRRAQIVCQIDSETLVASANLPKDMADLRPGTYDLTVRPYIDREGMLQFAIGSYVPVATQKAA